jgi:hypothetical protein
VNNWSPNASHDKWRRQLAGEKTGPHRPRINWANENWYEYFIMAWGGSLDRPTEFVGNRLSKTMTQMGRACNSPEAEWNCQGDDGFSPCARRYAGSKYNAPGRVYVLSV